MEELLPDAEKEWKWIQDAQQHSWRIDQLLQREVTNDPLDPLKDIKVDTSQLSLDEHLFESASITSQWMEKFERDIAKQFHIDSLIEEINSRNDTEENRIPGRTEKMNFHAKGEDSNAPQPQTEAQDAQQVDSSSPHPLDSSSFPLVKHSPRGLLSKKSQKIPSISSVFDGLDLSDDTPVNRSLLQSNISYLKELLLELQAQEASLDSTIERLKQEIQINEECETIEEKTENHLLRHPIMNSFESDEDDDEESLFAKDEDSGALVIRPDDDDDDDDYDAFSVNEDDSEETTDDIGDSSQSFAIKIIRKKQNLSEKLKNVKDLLRRCNMILHEYRKEKLNNVHLSLRSQMKESHYMKWLAETKEIENKTAEQLMEVKTKVENIAQEKEFLLDHLQFAETQTQYCQEILKQLVDILKGKQEVPSGAHLGVSRALQLYSQLKEVAARDALDMKYLKEFLLQHEAIFRISIPDFEMDL